MHLVFAMAPDRNFEFRIGLEPNRRQIRHPGRQFTRTVYFGTVRWKAPNQSGLGGFSAGCLAGPSVHSYNALPFAI